MSAKSEIRQSQLNALADRVKKNDYKSYLKSVTLTRVRGFDGAQVAFEFPVTALIGPNGGGKSTVLGAAACAYKETKPGIFFPKSSIGDTSMAEWLIQYELVDKSVDPKNVVRRSAGFRQLKWVRGDVVSRSTRAFGISRTVPAGERPQFKKLMRPSYSHSLPLTGLPDAAVSEIEHIIGKPVTDFRRTNIGGTDTFHVGKNRGNEYSEFHFGAGESSIIRIVTDIELLPENSMILIEEIENGLHPLATRRLVEYLIAAADRRRIQAIFTTHSDDALEVLPSEAVWACLDGQTQQGRLRVRALRAISGKVDTALAIFVEDEFGRYIVETAVREFAPDCVDQVDVFSVSGDGNAVKIHTTRKADPTTRHRSLCVLDGDSKQKDDPHQGIYRLPGDQPEAHVYGQVQDRLDTNLALLTVSLQLPSAKQDVVREAVNSIASTNRDPHLLFNQLGIELGFVPEAIVRGAFLSMWVREAKAAFDPLVAHIVKDIKEFSERDAKTIRQIANLPAPTG
jgi:energy-coupling factor transporter ATP-binding protein EcfA2